MSATATSPLLQKAPNFWQSTNGKKIVMAITGFLMVLFLIVHLLGNLLIFTGPEKYNTYASILHFDDVALWVAQVILIIIVVLHIVAAVQLGIRNKKARPVGYSRKKAINSSYASRTMYWSGPIVLAFIVFHLLEFTSGTIHPGSQFIPGNDYHNVLAGFQVPWIAAWYIFALILLGIHLSHGIWSMFQSMGWHNPRHSRHWRLVSIIISTLLILGFISIPASVLTGVLK